MKRRYWKLVISVLAVILLVALCMGNTIAASAETAGDVAGAVENTWNAAQGQIKQVVNNVVFPVIDIYADGTALYLGNPRIER